MKTLLNILAFTITLTIVAQNTYLHCGNIIDTKSGKVLNEKTIVIKGNTIVSVNDGFITSDNANDVIVDLKSKTVMPGLIDMHVHIEGETSPTRYLDRFTKNKSDVAFVSAEIANRTLLSGFTTVRDLGGSGVNVSLRDAINKGIVSGPRIYTAEKAIGTTGGHADPKQTACVKI